MPAEGAEARPVGSALHLDQGAGGGAGDRTGPADLPWPPSGQDDWRKAPPSVLVCALPQVLSQLVSGLVLKGVVESGAEVGDAVTVSSPRGTWNCVLFSRRRLVGRGEQSQA